MKTYKKKLTKKLTKKKSRIQNGGGPPKFNTGAPKTKKTFGERISSAAKGISKFGSSVGQRYTKSQQNFIPKTPNNSIGKAAIVKKAFYSPIAASKAIIGAVQESYQRSKLKGTDEKQLINASKSIELLQAKKTAITNLQNPEIFKTLTSKQIAEKTALSQSKDYRIKGMEDMSKMSIQEKEKKIQSLINEHKNTIAKKPEEIDKQRETLATTQIKGSNVVDLKTQLNAVKKSEQAEKYSGLYSKTLGLQPSETVQPKITPEPGTPEQKKLNYEKLAKTNIVGLQRQKTAADIAFKLASDKFKEIEKLEKGEEGKEGTKISLSPEQLKLIGTTNKNLPGFKYNSSLSQNKVKENLQKIMSEQAEISTNLKTNIDMHKEELAKPIIGLSSKELQQHLNAAQIIAKANENSKSTRAKFGISSNSNVKKTYDSQESQNKRAEAAKQKQKKAVENKNTEENRQVIKNLSKDFTNKTFSPEKIQVSAKLDAYRKTGNSDKLNTAIQMMEARIKRKGQNVTIKDINILERLKQFRDNRHGAQGTQGATPGTVTPGVVAPVAASVKTVEPTEVPPPRPPPKAVATPVAEASPRPTLVKQDAAAVAVEEPKSLTTQIKTKEQIKKDETHKTNIDLILSKFASRIGNGSVGKAFKIYKNNPSNSTKLNDAIKNLKARSPTLSSEDQKFLTSLMNLKEQYHTESNS
jgi:hypothetical protein